MAITVILAAWYGSIQAVLATQEDPWELPVLLLLGLIILLSLLWSQWRDNRRRYRSRAQYEHQANQKLSEAEEAYYDYLERLKRAPNDPDLRAETVRLGRQYGTLAKSRTGRSPINEMTIANDLLAACAGVNSAMIGESVTEEIEKLGQLFLKGVITAEEFERGKTLFLGTPVDKAASAVELLQNLDALKKQGVLSQSEFNMKKWEILSERLLPGKRSVADLR